MNTAKATAHLLKSKKARSYKANGNTYVLDIKKEGQELIVTTWGFGYERFTIPQSRPELIGEKNRIQFRLRDGRADSVDQVALHYYIDILRRNGESEPCTNCDGVGGYWPTEEKTITISSDLAETLDYLLENYNLTLETIIETAVKEKYEEVRAAYKSSTFLQNIRRNLHI